MRRVVDASVAVEYLLRTELGRAAAATLESSVLIAPELLDAEVAAVVRRLLLAGRLEERRAAEAIADLEAWNVERVPHRALLADVWSMRHDVSPFDALYLAVARAHGATVITADGPLARLPIRTGVIVENIRST